MRRIGIVALLIVCGCGLTKQPEPEFPIQFELVMGASRRVPYAATLWFASPEEVWDADQNAIIPAVHAEMECKGNRHGLTLKKDQLSEPVCGVQVRLVALIEPGSRGNDSQVFRAYFSVTKAP
jgi:hypothetical protein